MKLGRRFPYALFLFLLALFGGRLETFDVVSLISPTLVDHPIEVLVWVKDGVTPENEARVLEQIRQGLAMWEAVPTSRLAFNIVSVVHSAAEPTHPAGQLMIIVGNGADLESGGASFPYGGNPGTWYGAVADNPGVQVRKVTAHEVGHALGFHHTTVSDAFPAGNYPIMHWAIAGTADGLTPDDVAAVSIAYPDPARPLAGTTGSIRGRLVIAGTAIPINGINVVSVNHATGVPAVGRLSGPRTNPVGGMSDGVFELPGLTPGSYDVRYLDGHSYRGMLPGITNPSDGIINDGMRWGYQADNFTAFSSPTVTVTVGHTVDLGDIPVTVDPMRFDGLVVGDLTPSATYGTPPGEILPSAHLGAAYQVWLHIAGGLRDIIAASVGLGDGLAGTISGDVRGYISGVHGNHFFKITGTPTSGGYKTIDITLRDALGLRRDFAHNLTIEPVPADGLIARYSFSGNTRDGSGHGHHAANFGAVFVADRNGRPNRALTFDGVDDYLRLPHEQTFDLPELTIVALLKMPEARGVDDWIISKGTYFGNFTLLRNKAGGAWPGYGSYVHRSLAGNWSSVASGEPLPVNRFFCYAVSVSRDRFKAYVDGRRVREFLRPALPHYNDAPVLIGAGGYYRLSEHFRGVIDELMIYRGALDDTAVARTCSLLISSIPSRPRESIPLGASERGK